MSLIIVEPSKNDTPMNEDQRKAYLRAVFARMVADKNYDQELAIDDIADRWFGDVIGQRYLVATRMPAGGAYELEV
jgi:hypothetical protein